MKQINSIHTAQPVTDIVMTSDAKFMIQHTECGSDAGLSSQ